MPKQIVILAAPLIVAAVTGYLADRFVFKYPRLTWQQLLRIHIWPFSQNESELTRTLLAGGVAFASMLITLILVLLFL